MLKYKTITRLFASGLILIAGGLLRPAYASLRDIAESMQPGEWRILDGKGLTGALLDAGSGHNILEFAEDAKWDPGSQKFMLVGQGHYAEFKHIVFDANSNTWFEEAKPYWMGGIGHGYDQSAIDQERGLFFYTPFNSARVYQYKIANRTWSQLPDAPEISACCRGMEYFPELGGLVMVGNGTVFYYSDQTKNWSTLATNLPMGDYHNFAEYNPVRKVLIFGGGNGSRNLYKMDASGKITTLRNAPIPLGIRQSIVTTDPVSGDYLVFGSNWTFYTYNVATDAWTLEGSQPPFFTPTLDNPINCTVASPVNTYGVTMFLKFYWDQSTAYIYKHAPGSVNDNVLHVGPSRVYKTPVDALADASDGAVIEIDAGDYAQNAIEWPLNNLTLRGIGSVNILYNGSLTPDKTLWSFSGNNVSLENIAFSGATAGDGSARALLSKGANVTIKQCRIGTSDNGFEAGAGSVTILSCEFAGIGANENSFAVKIGTASDFTLEDCYFHSANGGVHVRGNAGSSFILYNRLTDEENGRSTACLSFPTGGRIVIIGNVLQKADYAPESSAVSFGRQSLGAGQNSFYFINNTVLMQPALIPILWVNSGAGISQIQNNLFVGNAAVLQGKGELITNLQTNAPLFEDEKNYDYRLTAMSPAIDRGSDPGAAGEFSLTPIFHYVTSTNLDLRPNSGALDVGAYEYGSARLALPNVEPDGGAFEQSVQVRLSGAAAGINLYYTLDGVDPGDKALLYNKPILLTRSTLLKAVAMKDGYPPSFVKSAQFTIAPDTAPPTVLSLSAQLDPPVVNVRWSEPVEIASAETPENYKIDGDVTVQAASLASDGRTTILHTSPLRIDKSYTLEISNVRDRAATPNTIRANSKFSFEVDKRVNEGLLSLYTFTEGKGDSVKDRSGIDPAIDLAIANPAKTEWGEGSLLIKEPTILSAASAQRIINACQISNEISIEAWIQPAKKIDLGPARIVTLSQDAYERNFTLGQDTDGYEIRLRTTTTGENGSNPATQVQTAIDEQLAHLVYTRAIDGTAHVYLNGAEVAARTDIGGDFSNWNNFQFALGNELDGDREWLGRFYLVALYSRALSFKDVQLNFNAGPYAAIIPTKADSNESAPETMVLEQNYPNPFNATTTIEFYLPEPDSVRLVIYTLAGKEVATLAQGRMVAGRHRLYWNAERMTSGVYLYKLTTSSEVAVNKMLLVK